MIWCDTEPCLVNIKTEYVLVVEPESGVYGIFLTKDIKDINNVLYFTGRGVLSLKQVPEYDALTGEPIARARGPEKEFGYLWAEFTMPTW